MFCRIVIRFSNLKELVLIDLPIFFSPHSDAKIISRHCNVVLPWPQNLSLKYAYSELLINDTLFSQKSNKMFARNSNLAFWKRSNKKISPLYTTNWMILFWLSYTTFLFDLFLEARVEILTITLVFWDIWRHQKDI